ncbi:vWA domain-containing protein [Haloarchaeobius amylolyticus]|uniref:vWA domain-containing protein n=1 Tax=Haloarchaeobius amylolyticus TaxID=1198296 RepID=UPI00226D787B|nr:vWA domain-containing protein [Haloarchaeobius amylolyticus]
MDTHVTFVLDSSGSMAKIEADTVGGFNSFLDEQRGEEGNATVSLYDFDSSVDRVYHGEDIEEAPELDAETYTPSGRTALHDAIVTAIDGTESYLAALDAADRPESVVIVILTDGKENASETSQQTVRNQVEYRREELEWEFLFIGANQDAALTAEGMGMDSKKSLDMAHSGEGARSAYESTSKRISNARRAGETGGFDEDDRKRQSEAGRSDTE